MTSIIAAFLVSSILSLVFTPVLRRIAVRYGFVDLPASRKVHQEPVPRIGGIAIFLAFFLTFLLAAFYPTLIIKRLWTPEMAILALGASVAFGVGVWDDFQSLHPGLKFFVQAVAACIAYAAGLGIEGISISNLYSWSLGWLSLPVTVFWFLLVMNAVNLIDGLDGLAAGLCLFVAIVLLIICVTTGRLLIAVGFAALGGATLGFLRYNFNPASIFMGDSGSYFLGYMLAGLSLMGTIKGPTTVAILIPIIAMGLPLMDAVISPIRRFILGQRLFSPDRKHLHHRLLELGLTQRNAVLFLYGVTIVLGGLAIWSVHANDEQIALILLVFSAIVILGIQKLGYTSGYFGFRRVHSWLKDVGDEMGVTWERRSFLNLQIEIYQSADIQSLWKNISTALNTLDFDMAEMYLEKKTVCHNINLAMGRLGFSMPEMLEKSLAADDAPEEQPGRFLWRRDGFDVHRDVCKDCLLKMELPLIDDQGRSFGSIWLVKDLCRNAISHYTLRRVEHLRRTVLGSLQVLMELNPKI